ncbi:MAG: alanine dehydrogenase [Gammaproteobacteria bacterium]|nr:alanine dehydrogenase [Gammaproteobacteria bacterium]
MIIGVPKEVKVQEDRVSLVPSSVRELVHHGHKVCVEVGAGAGIGIPDHAYEAVGAQLLNTPQEIFTSADLIVKVKEPQSQECKWLRPNQIIFTYLHLAANHALTRLLQTSHCIAIAYETITDAFNRLPLLSPMSEVAGRMAIQAGAHCLEKSQGGRGILLGGVPGVMSANVVVLGGGTAGTEAVRVAIGVGANVTVIDKSPRRLQELDLQFGSQLHTLYATRDAIETQVLNADLVVGTVLVPGEAAPRLVSRAMVAKMRPGSVIVDIAIDQGGCFETSRPTTHAQPTYIEEGVVHYCVTNMPGAVARTATFALNNVTLPFVLALAEQGCKKALLDNPHFLNGLNVCKGKITCAAVAKSMNEPYTVPTQALEEK